MSTVAYISFIDSSSLRLDTDIKFGNVNGFATCWVKTGIHKEEDVKSAMEENDPSLVPHFTADFVDLV